MTAKKPFTIADAEAAIELLSAELKAEVKPTKQRALERRIKAVRGTKIDLLESKMQGLLLPTKFQKQIKI
jgi:hypothetical protein